MVHHGCSYAEVTQTVRPVRDSPCGEEMAQAVGESGRVLGVSMFQLRGTHEGTGRFLIVNAFPNLALTLFGEVTQLGARLTNGASCVRKPSC